MKISRDVFAKSTVKNQMLTLYDSNEQMERSYSSLTDKMDAVNKKLDIICPQITKYKVRTFVSGLIGGGLAYLTTFFTMKQ